VKFNPVAEGLT